MGTETNSVAFEAVQKNYLWMAIGFFLPPLAFYAVYTTFKSRALVNGTWLESHTDYQIRLISVMALLLAAGIIAGMLHIGLLSAVVFGFMWLWFMLRVAKGWSKLGVEESADANWI